ncbi:TetR/AcrR family transcriptional regulator [Streptomonospora sediminis]
MARWDPGAHERLTKAALDLFVERGYDNVTVADIAERAGLTRRSFFRYFPDKREALFAGSEQLPAAMREAVLCADPAAAPLAAVFEALDRVGSQTAATVGRTHAARRRGVIAASAELQERERTKAAAVTDAVDQALRQRGTEPGTATLVAQVGAVVLAQAFQRWIDGEDFTPALRDVIDTLSRECT